MLAIESIPTISEEEDLLQDGRGPLCSFSNQGKKVMDDGSSKSKIAQVNIHQKNRKQRLRRRCSSEHWYYRGQIRGLSSKDAKVILDTKH